MAKPNYQFEKRQRDLEKKRKQEEKRQRKVADKASAGAGNPGVDTNEAGVPAETGHAGVSEA